VQVDPIITTLTARGTKRLKLKSDEMLSSFAVQFNLRRNNKGSGETGCKRESACASNNGGRGLHSSTFLLNLSRF